MSDTKPGPASPQEDGPDAPTPPGGPQRQDASGTGLAPADTGAGEPAADSVEDQHGSTIPVEDEQPDPHHASEETPAQRENAEASTQQPSQ